MDGIRAALRRLDLGEWGGYTFTGGQARTSRALWPEMALGLRASQQHVPPPILRAGHVPAPPVVRARTHWARIARSVGTTLPVLERMAGVGPVPVATVILGADARGTGTLFCVEGELRLQARTKRMLFDLAAHIAAMSRLRARIRLDDVDAADAVLSPSAGLLHGSPVAVEKRESLALAVKNIDRARQQLRPLDAEEAVAHWTAMFDGRWSLVEHVERDGRRLVLAHRNPMPSSIGALRAREAQVATLASLGHADKYIGYELGLARTTVATHLRRALVKLGLRDRRELVYVYGPLACLAGEGAPGPAAGPKPTI